MKIDLGIERNMPVLLSPRELKYIRNKTFLITPMVMEDKNGGV